MKLTARLNAVLSAVPSGTRVADVGTDHGKLAYALLEQGVASKVIATDVSAPSLAKAQKLIGSSQYATLADFRVGDGLTVVDDGEVDVVVIGGMGGREICKIVTNGPKFPTYVLSPQRDADLVRRTMQSLGYYPSNEVTVKDDGKFYFVMTFAVGSCDLSEEELFFGKQNLLSPTKAFKEYLAEKVREYALLAEGNQNSRKLLEKADKYKSVLEKIDESK